MHRISRPGFYRHHAPAAGGSLLPRVSQDMRSHISDFHLGTASEKLKQSRRAPAPLHTEHHQIARSRNRLSSILLCRHLHTALCKCVPQHSCALAAQRRIHMPLSHLLRSAGGCHVPAGARIGFPAWRQNRLVRDECDVDWHFVKALQSMQSRLTFGLSCCCNGFQSGRNCSAEAACSRNQAGIKAPVLCRHGCGGPICSPLRSAGIYLGRLCLWEPCTMTRQTS